MPGQMEIIILFCVLVFLAMFFACIAFWIWALIDCLTNEPSGDDSKVIWILILLLAGLVGAIIYSLARRPERIRMYGR